MCFALDFMSGFASFLTLGVCSVMTRFAPGTMMSAFFFTSNQVSDFIAAMNRMHVTEKIMIPMSVIFRFFPTIRKDNSAIGDAMRMRGIRFGGKHPGKMLEYRLIPLIISIVGTGDELFAAVLTRDPGNPVKYTDICELGLHLQDIIMTAPCAVCFILTIRNRWFGDGNIGIVLQNARSQFFNVDTTSELSFGCENLGIPKNQILRRRLHDRPVCNILDEVPISIRKEDETIAK